MAHPDWSASRIAKEMGVVRSYVHATATRNNIVLAKQVRPRASAPRPITSPARHGFSQIEIAALRQVRDCGLVYVRRSPETAQKFTRLHGLGYVAARPMPAMPEYTYVSITKQGADLAKRMAL